MRILLTFVTILFCVLGYFLVTSSEVFGQGKNTHFLVKSVPSDGANIHRLERISLWFKETTDLSKVNIKLTRDGKNFSKFRVKRNPTESELSVLLTEPSIGNFKIEAFMGKIPQGPGPQGSAPLASINITAVSESKFIADCVWVLLAAFLVFFMNAGFALVESGFCRAKNAVNILAKNFIVFAIATLAYWAVGFALMFGDGSTLVGFHGFLFDPKAEMGFSSLEWTAVPLAAKFFFQLVFAATAATIVSGAVAERIKFNCFVMFSFVLVALVYPIAGHWIWGGGFLSNLGFFDFAGSTVVHSVGGWAALAGVIVLGPRLGKYGRGGQINSIPGHSMALATLGGLILWLGWFGFNPGSTMSADADAIAHIALTTNLAAAAGVMAATFTAWIKIGTPDLSMLINGALAGLVAITAPCAFVSPVSAIIIGTVAGILVVVSVIAFDKIRIDDPVGALSVHLVNGVWGTLAVGLFAQDPYASAEGMTNLGLLFNGGLAQFWAQLKGVVVVGAFVFPLALFFWGVLRFFTGLRVSPEEEIAGLDISEMGMEAYPQEPFLPIESLEERKPKKEVTAKSEPTSVSESQKQRVPETLADPGTYNTSEPKEGDGKQ